MKLNYYLKKELHQLEVYNPCPGCGRFDKLAVRDKVLSYCHNRTEYYIGCNCGWTGPTRMDPLEAATAWDQRFYYIE